jgi:VanZ family protein
MEQKKYKNIGLEIVVIVASVLALMLLLYFVMIVSFQSGDTSTSMTMDLATQIARRIFDNPTQDEIETISLSIRYGAHLGLFFVVGLVTTFVSMVIFRRYYRILGVIGAGVICYVLAYYTEYYKQFVEGRHFQLSDATLNWYGSLAGIVCMVGSYFLNRLLVKLSS